MEQRHELARRRSVALLPTKETAPAAAAALRKCSPALERGVAQRRVDDPGVGQQAEIAVGQCCERGAVAVIR